MAKKKNQIFKGAGTGSGVAAGTTPAKITTQVNIATAAPKQATSNPFQANTASGAGSNPYISSGSGAMGGAVGAAAKGAGCNGKCKKNERCVNGQCVPQNDGTGNVCQNNNQCGSNKQCIGGYCVPKGSSGGGGGGGGPEGGPCAGLTYACGPGKVPTQGPNGSCYCADPNAGGGNVCAGVTCPPGTSCMPSPSGSGHTCAPDRVPPPSSAGSLCSAANPQGSCPSGQLCDNGTCRPLPSSNANDTQIDMEPDAYYRFLVGRGGLHTNRSNALGAFITDQYDDIHEGWRSARMQNPGLNFREYMTRTFGAEQMLADYLRRRFLGSSAEQQGFRPSDYGSGPARWSVF